MPPLLDLICFIALGFCAALGLGALFAPKWAAGVVRLTADPNPDHPGGFSEFRATYGGLLFMLHITAIIILMQLTDNDTTEVILMKVFMLMPIAAAWLGAGFGRTLSLIMDGKDNRSAGLIPVWIPMEIALGLAIAAPVLQLVA